MNAKVIYSVIPLNTAILKIDLPSLPFVELCLKIQLYSETQLFTTDESHPGFLSVQ